MDFTVGIVSQNLLTPSNFVEFQDRQNFMFFEALRVTNNIWHLFGWLTISHVSNGEEKSKVQGVAMCHNLIGWKSKVLDKWIREIQKEPMVR